MARSKGHLYLLVTSRLASRHGLEATRLAAETIRNEYYYDESAGIRVCLQKAIMTANKRLAHQADRLGLKTNDGNGPIGVAVAVVRGNEMYVATVGPAEAYLIRQARLSTLPDPQRDRGLPAGDLEPDVWRGEVAVGDSLVLISPNVMTKLGADELKDAMLTLHPQSAMEHLHHRFVAADGSGSDGAIAFEASEVSATSKARTLVPVKPAEPLAGAPDRSPIPLADNVAAAGSAVTAAAGSARVAAGGAMERLVARLQDVMPRRKPAYRRVTPLATRRETQRRAAHGRPGPDHRRGRAGPGRLRVRWLHARPGDQFDQRRAEGARHRQGQPGQGVRTRASTSSPTTRTRHANCSWRRTNSSTWPRRPRSRPRPSRRSGPRWRPASIACTASIPVASTTRFTFQPAEGANPIDLRGLVRGPDGAPYVLDRSTRSVYRIDLKAKKATLVARFGQKAGGGTVASPRYIGLGATSDLLILDSKNVLWRWRPADETGKGTLVRIDVNGATSWGDDIKGFGTFLRDEAALALQPVRDRSVRAADPGLLAVRGRRRLPGRRLTLDGHGPGRVDDVVHLHRRRPVRRSRRRPHPVRADGKSDGWEAKAPEDTLLRPAPVYSMVTGGLGTKRRTGWIYAYDKPNERIVAIDKTDGTYKGQYRLAGGVEGWDDMRAFYVVPGVDEAPSQLVWISRDGLHQSALEAVADVAPQPSASPGASGSPSTSAKPSAAP